MFRSGPSAQLDGGYRAYAVAHGDIDLMVLTGKPLPVDLQEALVIATYLLSPERR